MQSISPYGSTKLTRVLVITPQYAPDFGPSAPIYTALCEDLAQMGYDVTVITAFPNFTGSGATQPQAKRFFQSETRNGVHVIRTYIYSVPKKSLWKRLLYHGSFNLFSTMAALRIRKPDILLADAPTLWSGLPLMIKALLPGTPYIYVLHDIYPDVLSQLDVLHNPRILNLIASVENFYYRRSAQISVLSEGFRQNLLHKGVPDEKITIIPACVDTDFIHSLPKENKFLGEWGLEGKFIVLYAGNIGLSQGLENALQAAKILTDETEIVFVFVGDGATKQGLEAMAEDLALENVKFFPFQPREDVPLIYALADICLVSLKSNIVVESVPSKTYTIMASGKPIVAVVDESSEVSNLLQKAECGLCIRPGNPQALAEAIRKLYTDTALRNEMGRNGREHVLENYTRQVASQRYKAAIDRYVSHR
jgi:colanic acid biosynthesis glycosyl transferase WcaI